MTDESSVVEAASRVAVSVVVPTYEEAENLPELVGRIKASLEKTSFDWDVIVVDDDSNDGIEELVDQMRQQNLPVRIIVRKGVRGLSSAVLEGFRNAEGDVLICMDADLSHPPEQLPLLVEEVMRDDVDFVIGSRYVPGASTDETWGVFRWMNSKIATLMARPFTKARDPMAGFFALRRKAFEQSESLSPVGYKIGLELIVKCNAKNVAEIPIHFADRKRGTSKLSLREQVNYLRHLKRLADYKFGWLSRLGQFCLIGAIGMMFDLVSYAILLRVGLLLSVARFIAIWIAMTWNFWLNRRITFSYSRKSSLPQQYAKFVLTCSVGAVVNWGVSIGLVRGVHFFSDAPILAAVVGVAAGTLFNFALSMNWAFRRKKSV